MRAEQQLKELRAVAASAARLLREIQARAATNQPQARGLDEMIQWLEAHLPSLPSSSLYHVSLSYEADGDRGVLGQWTGLAANAEQARQRCMAVHWDARLDSVGARAVWDVAHLLRYVICDNWGHQFGHGCMETTTRWVIDRAGKGFAVAQAKTPHEGPEAWRDLSMAEAAELMDNLRVNFDYMDSEEVVEYGLELLDELPAWAFEAGEHPVHEVRFDSEQIALMARLFLHGLLTAIGPERLREVSLANQAELNPGVCHTHDACDANMVMASAFERVMGVQVDLRSSSQARLWDEAWSLARRKMPQFVQLVDAELHKRSERQRG